MMLFGLWARTCPTNHELGGVQIPLGRGNFGGKGRPLESIGTSCHKLCKTAQPMDVLFGLWTLVGWRKHKFNRICQVAPMCLHGRAHWRHLSNTIEPSVCGGDAALCQITLTTLVSTCSAQNAVCWNTDDTDCTEKHQGEWVIYKIVTTWNVMVTTQQTAVSRLFPVGLLAPILLVQYF